mmetsp:Transcript_36777/g.59307  ORF Transcript_36777/g.59307 Transcript_36777/m.59307 type:complete len:324 (+) Transcript_36777:154-1125(+)
MVAESRKPARGHSPAPARSKSPSKSQPKTSSKTPSHVASSGSGVFLLVALAAVAGGVMLAIVHGVPANITALLKDGLAGGGVNYMGMNIKQVDAFLSSFTMILGSEIGDKTFFIAAVLAMKESRVVVLGGALSALALMTALSAAMGAVITQILPHEYTHYLAVLLFVVFGIKLLKDAQDMNAEGPSEELEEVEAELNKSAKKKDPDMDAPDRQKGKKGGKGGDSATLAQVAAVVWQAFSLTFVAEWGDRSQVSTIAMAAQKDALAVTAGGVLGHACCTSLAVIGGRMLASRISERTVTMAGGALFLIFAMHGILQDPNSSHND